MNQTNLLLIADHSLKKKWYDTAPILLLQIEKIEIKVGIIRMDPN